MPSRRGDDGQNSHREQLYKKPTYQPGAPRRRSGSRMLSPPLYPSASSGGPGSCWGHAPKSVHPRRASGPYLRSGLLRCETCGKALTAAEAESGKSTYYILPLPAEAGQRNMQDPRAQYQDLREAHRQRDQGEHPQRVHHPGLGEAAGRGAGRGGARVAPAVGDH